MKETRRDAIEMHINRMHSAYLLEPTIDMEKVKESRRLSKLKSKQKKQAERDKLICEDNTNNNSRNGIDNLDNTDEYMQSIMDDFDT